MTNLDYIDFIDNFLAEQEDYLHGEEGENCTKSRKYLEKLKEQLTLTDVVKSFYCECDFPIVRTSVNMDEYCGDCGKDIKQ